MLTEHYTALISLGATWAIESWRYYVLVDMMIAKSVWWATTKVVAMPKSHPRGHISHQLAQRSKSSKLLDLIEKRYQHLPESKARTAQVIDFVLLISLIGSLAINVETKVIDQSPGATLAFVSLAILYVYTYNVIEDKYLKSSVGRYLDKSHPKRNAILIHRLTFLVAFMCFQTIFLSNWGLHGSTNPEVPIQLHIIQSVVVAAVIGLMHTPTGPAGELKFWRGSVFWLLLAVFLAAFTELGAELSENRFLQDIASTIVIAVIIAAATSIYIKVVNRLVHDKRWR